MFIVLSLANLRFNGCIRPNINHMARQHCFSFTDDSDRHYCVAQFLRELLLLRDRPDISSNVLTRTEIDFIVRYL